MGNNDNMILNETSKKRSHHHKHKKHSTPPRKKTFKEKIKSLWKKFLKKLGGEGTKKETSILLTFVIIMVITVPIVIALLDLLGNYLTTN